MGNPKENTNTSYILQRGRDVLTSEGIPADAADAIMAEVTNQDSRMSGSDIGSAVAASVQAQFGAIEADMTAARKWVAEAVQRASKRLQKFIGEGPKARAPQLDAWARI